MILNVNNGTFGYGKGRAVLSGINFTLNQAEVLSVLGPNGVGKTTLLKCMLGLLTWTQGETLIDDAPLKSIPYKKLWQTVGYVPQAKQAAFAYKIEDMVLLGRSAHLKMLEHPGKKDIEIVHEVLDSLGILHLKDKLCSKISGGELQMVLIARALASMPKLLILDEPESNLDFRNQLIVLETIQRLAKERKISVILNTHYPEHAIAIADRTLLLNKAGNSIFGKTEEVISENNLGKVFDVRVGIQQIDFDICNYTCVAPLSLKT